jgi:hypothetical protein
MTRAAVCSALHTGCSCPCGRRRPPAAGRTAQQLLPAAPQVNREVVKQLTIDYAYVLGSRIGNAPGKLVDPPFPPFLDFLYGRDYLARPERSGAIYTMEANKTIFSGPYKCAEGFTCVCESVATARERRRLVAAAQRCLAHSPPQAASAGRRPQRHALAA